MKKNKGFTLIELLAVIVILGILMAVAIPAMTKYIENSKKDAFWQTGKTYVNAARYGLLNDEYANDDGICGFPETNTATIVPTKIIELEKGSRKSSWNKELQESYVVCVDTSTDPDKPKYVYYYAGMDTDKNGITTAVKEDSLNRSYVLRGKANTPAIPTKGATISVIDGSGGNAISVTVSKVCSK